ncbi:MAG: T9SS type A sorting domain-containing protein [Chitinophagales bacterium]|nr:T9SS type A sorting domain-containing protein [Chitinophagales bacterium]
MAKKWLINSSFLLCAYCAFATHYRAADITYKIIGPYQIESTITTYSKYDGVSIQADKNEVIIFWGDATADTVIRANGVDGDSDGFKDGETVSTQPISIKKNIYTARHTYPGPPPPQSNCFIVSFIDINRIDGIANFASSVDLPLYIADTIFADNFLPATGFNTGPIFTRAPIDYGNLNDTFTSNQLVYDADGDSLSFELIAPMIDANQSVPLYKQPDQYCQPRGYPTNSFSINQQTGAITWSTPCQIGIFNVAILVKEYRCGTLLSTDMSDFQIIVLNERNDPPLPSIVVDTFINPGDSISFNVSATDPDVGQTVYLEAAGGALGLAQPPVFTTNAGNPATGQFTWQTDSSMGRKNAYIFAIIASDNYTQPGTPPIVTALKTYQTFRVWVTDTSQCAFVTSVSQLQQNLSVTIFPNPANDQLHVYCEEETIEAICIFNTTGQLLLQTQKPANNTIDISNLTSGVYIAEIKTKAGSVMKRWVKM